MSKKQVPIMSAYEILRERNIQRNEGFLKGLGVQSKKADPKPKMSKEEVEERKRKREEETSKVEPRRSSRPSSQRTVSFVDVPMAYQFTVTCQVCKYKTHGFLTQQEAEDELKKIHSPLCLGIAVSPPTTTSSSTKYTQRHRAKANGARDQGQEFPNCRWCGWKSTDANGVGLKIHISRNAFCLKANNASDGDLLLFSRALGKKTVHETHCEIEETVSNATEEEVGDFDFGCADGDFIPETGLVVSIESEEDNKFSKEVLILLNEGHDAQPTVEELQDSSQHMRNFQLKLTEELRQQRHSRKFSQFPMKAVASLHKLGTHLRLSESEGDMLLATVNELLDELKVTKPRPSTHIYKRWDGLRSMCDGDLKFMLPIIKLNFPMPQRFLGLVELNSKKPLRPVVSYHNHILDLLAMALLETKPIDFHTNPAPEFTEGQCQRIYSAYPSGNLFIRHSVDVWNTASKNFVALMVMIFRDAAAAGTVSVCPVQMFILNTTGDSFRPWLVGYSPVRFPYSNATFLKLLIREHPNASKERLLWALRSIKAEIQDHYMSKILAPLADHQLKGLRVQVGHDDDAEHLEIVVVPRISHSCGDSEQLQKDGQVSHRCKWGKCRICMCIDCTHYPTIDEDARVVYRDTNQMTLLSNRLDKIYFGQLKAGKGKRVTDLADRDTISTCKTFGVISGPGLTRKMYTSISGNVFPYYRSLALDILHANFMGPTQYCLSWSLIIISALARCKTVRFSQFQSASAILDERVANSPLKDALYPTPRPYRHPQGVSGFVTTDGGTKNRGTASAHLGGIPGFLMSGLLFQMMMAIACTPHLVLPNIRCIKSSAGKKFYNPLQTVCQTAAAILDLNFAVAAKKATDVDLQKMDMLIRNANIKLTELYDLKQVCLRLAGVLPPSEKVNVADILKCHLMTHLPEQCKELGKLSLGFDTQIGEHEMKDMKKSYSMSSKKRSIYEKEMLHNHYRDFLVDMLWKYQFASESAPLPKPPEKEFLEYFVVANMGSVQLFPISAAAGKDSYRLELESSSERRDKNRHHHPLLTLPILEELLSNKREAVDPESATDSFFISWFDNYFGDPVHRNSNLFFRGGLSCPLGHESAEIDPFHIRADRECGKEGHGATAPEFSFSTLQVSYEEQPTMAYFVKVLAIVDLVTFGGASQILLVVAQMTQVHNEKSDCHLGYPLFKFSRVDLKLQLNFVTTDTVLPAFMQQSSYPYVRESLTNFARLRYYCISVDRKLKHKNQPYENYGKHNTYSETAKEVFLNAKGMDTITNMFRHQGRDLASIRETLKRSLENDAEGDDDLAVDPADVENWG